MDDTMRYFIYGMNGGYSRLTPEAIAELRRPDLPLGNLLFRAASLRRVLPRLTLIELFDLGALSLVIRALHADRPDAIGFSAVISALHSGAEDLQKRVAYNEYHCLDEVRRQEESRDAHLFAALEDDESVLLAIRGKYEPSLPDEDIGGLASRNSSFFRSIRLALRDWPRLRGAINGLLRPFVRLLKR